MTQISCKPISSYRAIVRTARMKQEEIERQNQRWISQAEKTVSHLSFDPLRNYERELLETYKTVLLEIGIDYDFYLSRHASSKGSK